MNSGAAATRIPASALVMCSSPAAISRNGPATCAAANQDQGPDPIPEPAQRAPAGGQGDQDHGRQRNP